MEENIPNQTAINPTPVDKPCCENNIKCGRCWKAGVLIVGILLAVSIAYAGWQFSQKQTPSPLPTPTPVVQLSPSPTPDLYTEASQSATANWKTYTNQKYNYLMKYPQNWTVEEFLETRPQFNDSYQSTVFYSPNKEYALSFGLRKAGETIKLSGRTGVSAGDFVTGTSIVIAGESIPTKNLVYKDKLKAVFYQSGDFFSIGNFEANADFDRVAIDDYDSRDLTNSPELLTANQILSTFRFLE